MAEPSTITPSKVSPSLLSALDNIPETPTTPTNKRRRKHNAEPGGSLQNSSQNLRVRTGGFNLNYDNESPRKRIDRGGPDQSQK
jgi:hypothetical protein